MQFEININSPKVKVWHILWDDKSFREWAGIIDEGTYMVGKLKEGNEVQFISAINGYGVTSLIYRLIENEFLLLKHKVDTQDSGARDRADEWSGGEESYLLKEKDGITTLTVVFDVPDELREYFEVAYPKALGKIKQLAES